MLNTSFEARTPGEQLLREEVIDLWKNYDSNQTFDRIKSRAEDLQFFSTISARLKPVIVVGDEIIRMQEIRGRSLSSTKLLGQIRNPIFVGKYVTLLSSSDNPSLNVLTQIPPEMERVPGDLFYALDKTTVCYEIFDVRRSVDPRYAASLTVKKSYPVAITRVWREGSVFAVPKAPKKVNT